MKIVLKPLFWLSVACFILMVIVHALALMRIRYFTAESFPLVVPILMVFGGPLALLRERLVQIQGAQWRQKIFFPGTPRWVKFAMGALGLYLLANVLFLAEFCAGPGRYANTACFSAFLLVALANFSVNFWYLQNQSSLL